ncbi:MAG TPA: YaeQ family protein [Thermoanaerobaculia bacterium]|nr:YaeQ family protein [Thermoanaerobaculia bacterium]
MALTATIFNLSIELADIDRGVYETLDLRVARQPSETAEYMLMRVLAYCLEYTEGISLSQGVAAGDEPAISVRDLTGQVTAWIEVGMPDAERIHRGSKLAGRAAIYTHREPRHVLAQFEGKRIHRSDEIPVYSFEPAFVQRLASLIDRRTELALTITERQLYVEVQGETLSSKVTEQRIT